MRRIQYMLEAKDVEVLVKSILEDTSPDSIDPQRSLEECGLNSISAISLVVLIEEKYDIIIDDEDLLIEKFNTIDRIIQTVSKYVRGDKILA
jgi:acyl carrier protein